MRGLTWETDVIFLNLRKDIVQGASRSQKVASKLVVRKLQTKGRLEEEDVESE